MAFNLWSRFCTLIYDGFPTFSFPASATRTRPFDFFFRRRGSTNLFHQGIFLIIPQLIAFLQLKYQGIQDTPFTTDPKTTTISVFTIFAYFLTHGVLLRPSIRQLIPPGCADFLRQCTVWFGNSSVALLLSVLLPGSIRPFLYVLFASVSSGELLPWVYWMLSGEEDGGRRGIGRFVDNLGRLVGNSSSDRRFILPR